MRLFRYSETIHNIAFCISDNLALEKPTVQSSIYADNVDNHYAGNAVDGVKNDYHNFCTHTSSISANPWWGVDLEQVLPISEVSILNRGDCCGDRLNDAEIRVGEYSLVKWYWIL